MILIDTMSSGHSPKDRTGLSGRADKLSVANQGAVCYDAIIFAETFRKFDTAKGT